MVEHETSVFMRFFRKYFVFGSKLAYLISCWKNEAPNWRRFSSVASKLMPLSGAGFLLWHQNWCHFEYLLTYSQWEQPFSKVFLKKSSNNLLLRGNPFIAPSLTPCLKAILWTPSKRFPYLTHVWRPFCQPICRKFRLNLLQQLSEPKNDTFPETFFKKCSHPSTARFRTKNGSTFSKKFPTPIPQVFSGKSKHLFQKNISTTVTGTFEVQNGTPILKKHKNSACLVFRSRRYIFSDIQL